jgi:tetratricopeptide (TPR) repeat protein
MELFTDEEYMFITRQLTDNDRWEDADRFADKCLQQNPLNTEALIWKGNYFAGRFRLDEALEYYTRAIEAEPDNANAWYLRGDVHVNRKDHAAAIQDLMKAKELYATYHADTYRLLAFCLLEMKEYAACNEVCDQIRDNHFDDYYAYTYKYQCLVRMGELEELITIAQKQIYAGPESAEYHNKLGYGFLLLEDYPRSIRHFDDALHFEPFNSNALNNKGWALFKMGHYEDAPEFFDSAIQNDMSNTLAYHHRAFYHLQVGRRDLAKLDLLRARELNYRAEYDSEVDDTLLKEFKISAEE